MAIDPAKLAWPSDRSIRTPNGPKQFVSPAELQHAFGDHSSSGDGDRRLDVHAVLTVGVAKECFTQAFHVVRVGESKTLVVLDHPYRIAGRIEQEEIDR